MRCKRLWIVLFVLLLWVVTPVAYAQDGDGDKFVVGEDYVLQSGEVLHGSLAVVRGTATIEAGSTVVGDIAVLGGQLSIAGTVYGDVAVLAGSVSLTDSAIVEGDLASFGGVVERAPGAQLRGETLGGPRLPGDTVLPDDGETSGAGGFIRKWITWQLGTLGWGLLLVLLGVAGVALAPRAMGRMATSVATQPAMNFGLGLLTLAVGVLGGAILLVACGLGLLVWLALLLALLVGWIAVGLWAGQRLLAAARLRTPSSLVEVAVGVFGITVLSRLPACIGFLFSVVVGAIGLGAVVLTRIGSQAPQEVSAGDHAPDTRPLALPVESVQEPSAPELAITVPEMEEVAQPLPEPPDVSGPPPDEPSAPASTA